MLVGLRTYQALLQRWGPPMKTTAQVGITNCRARLEAKGNISGQRCSKTRADGHWLWSSQRRCPQLQGTVTEGGHQTVCPALPVL